MRVRFLEPEDIPILKEWHARSGIEYVFPDLDSMERVYVIERDDGTIITACAAEEILQLYLLMGADLHPAEKLASVQLLHEFMTQDLRERGYREVNAFVPPQLAKSFGRRLARTFGWVKNWDSWCKRF